MFTSSHVLTSSGNGCNLTLEQRQQLSAILTADSRDCKILYFVVKFYVDKSLMMGVTTLKDKNGVIQQEDSSMTVTAETTEETKAPPKSPRAPKKLRKVTICRQWDLARNVKKSAGVRQTRRAENLSNLLTMVEDFEEVDIVEPTYSAFTALFMEHEKMKLWNDFLNRPEEDQQQMLDRADRKEEEEKDNDEEFETLEQEEKDGRQAHPAFSGEECFHRVDGKLRSFLHKNHVPLGALEHLENDLMSFFKDYPTSVLVTRLGSSFERLLLHALCQYLDLSSHSYDDNSGGGRHTEVENKQQQFTPPNMTLTEYLEQAGI